ncbi:MAG: AI-2E family transporter [Pseudomonadales bacterium]|jgi:putative permease|nr:AI-2E family transporter [Pseudomonadales bacterium]MDP6471024.1 AI-2E family transporter [Pseudomonadales bacterium]MDP6825790.1 AI-2E family transporter [Pseudomonadales bacterium]MDP6970216.1 AI-2E family transporter [Pseudomonadales bacterium]|tara:strand:- start:2151 stop:3239 length:1089 start_codon:yes stop_codon:yes gene_type:complete
MKFLEVIGAWINHYFSNEEAIYLVVLLLVIFITLFTLGDVLAPVLTGLVVAFLLDGLTEKLVALKLPDLSAVIVTFALFVGVLFAVMLFVAPLVWRQLQGLLVSLPDAMVRVREVTQELADSFPELVTEQQINTWLENVTGEIVALTGSFIEAFVTNVPSLVGVLIYVVLVPISVFFFLKDRHRLLEWFHLLLPDQRSLLSAVGAEMNVQLANYVRGKFIEILIVGSVTFIALQILGLNYAALLGVLVGVSVLIPFIGAAVVTIPVFLVAVIQFGWSWDLTWVMVAYGIIQALDGNVLVPLLFSEAVDLHPITIIVAVLAFGGLWGVWGVFFAIPLATLIKAIYNAWPRELQELPVPERAAE